MIVASLQPFAGSHRPIMLAICPRTAIPTSKNIIVAERSKITSAATAVPDGKRGISGIV